MHSNIETTKKYELVCLENSDNVFFLLASVTPYIPHSARSHAIALVYTRALLAGAGNYTRAAFTAALGKHGATLDVSYSQGHYTFSVKCRTDVVTPVLSLWNTMLTKPAFLPTELTRITKQLHNELAEYVDHAQARAHDEFLNACFNAADHRYQPSPQSLQSALTTITTDDLHALHKQVCGHNWTVTFTGNQRTESLIMNNLDHTVSLQQQSASPTIKQSLRLITTPKVTLTSIPSKQNVEFSLGGILPRTLIDADYQAFVFGLNVLGKWGGFAGRLMSTVREKEGLTYTIYARTEGVSTTAHGVWRILTFFTPQQTLQGVRSTLREITKIKEKGITTDELTRFKNILHTRQVLALDSVTGYVHEIHAYRLAGIAYTDISDYKQRLLQVTKQEVNRALHTYLDPQQLIISGAGPTAGLEKNLKQLLH